MMYKLILMVALATAATAAQAAPIPRPKLIVAISVDQYSSEVFRRYWPTYTAGLGKLASGIAYPTGYQSHAMTETCPGHATILTGRHPAGTGIVGNSWYDAKTGSSVYCVSVPGAGEEARGPQNMKATTLGDWIKAARPGSRSFAVAGKDRAAITMAGHHADGVYWWAEGGGFVTSRFAGPAHPDALKPVEAFNATLTARWTAAPPTLWPAPSAACAALARPQLFGQLMVSGDVPPELAHGATGDAGFLASKAFGEALRASPVFDALVADFALDLITREQLGRGPATDVLAIGLSATDYIGHRLGNGGAEMCVHQAALDETIGRLLGGIEAMGVPFIVMLTADHGGADASERHFDEGGAAHRIDAAGLMRQLGTAVTAELGISGSPFHANNPRQIYIRDERESASTDKIIATARTWLENRPEVKAVFTRDEIAAAALPPGTPPDRLSLVQRFRANHDPDRSGDIAVVYAERSSYGIPRRTGDTVAGHGTPWDHDRQVPILFWWPGIAAETRDQPVAAIDIAPTLAGIAGIRPPEPIDGRCLDLGGNCSGAGFSR